MAKIWKAIFPSISFSGKSKRECSFLMNTKVASGKLVIEEIPYAFSEVFTRLANSLSKTYSLLLRYKVIYSKLKYLAGLWTTVH